MASVDRVYISPNYYIGKSSNLPRVWDIDTKIKIFKDMVFGFQLDIADKVINGEKDEQDKIIRKPTPNSGYAVLSIVLSYFEMISKFQEGYCLENRSEEHFKKSVRSVFPELKKYNRDLVGKALDVFYKDVRCGLYHQASTNKWIALERNRVVSPAFYFDSKNKILKINPYTLIPCLNRHFEDYIERLRNVKERELRKKFEQRFNYSAGLPAPKPLKHPPL